MRLQPTTNVLRSAAVAAMLALWACGGGGPAAPETRRDDTVETLHGVSIADPYRWLEDGDSAETREWIERQQAHASSVLQQAPPTTALRQRLEELFRVDETYAPSVRGGRYVFARRPGDRDRNLLYAGDPTGTVDEVLVDPQAIDDGVPVFVGYADASSNGAIVAYTVRRADEAEVEVRFLDPVARRHLPDTLERGRYGNVSLDAEGSGVYYDRRTADGPRVFHRVFGGEAARDRVVFGRGYGPEKVITSRLSSNGRYLLITVRDGAGAVRSELYFRDTWTGTQVHTIVNDIDADFVGRIGGDTLFVLTDWDAPNRRIFAANLRRPGVDSWTEIIAEGDSPIDGLATIGGRLMVRRGGRSGTRFAIHEPDGFPVREVAFAADEVVGELGDGSWEGDEVFFSVSAMFRPPTVYRYRVSDGDRRVWAENRAPLEPDAFHVERVSVPVEAGVSVPMLVAHRRDLPLDETHPALLSSSGGFGHRADPGFDRAAAVWVENGGVWASADVRGGGGFGATWRRDGMRDGKLKAVGDLLAAAEWLTQQPYAAADRLALRGEGDGGLLAAAALTRRPDLFAAVVSRHPLIDMLRYQLFFDGPAWMSEYGSADDPEQFGYLASYSPYHNVVDGSRYPSVMLVADGGDTRIAPLHARKMIARLQAATRSSNPIVLRYGDGVGSAGTHAINVTISELAAEIAFLLWRTG